MTANRVTTTGGKNVGVRLSAILVDSLKKYKRANNTKSFSATITHVLQDFFNIPKNKRVNTLAKETTAINTPKGKTKTSTAGRTATA